MTEIKKALEIKWYKYWAKNKYTINDKKVLTYQTHYNFKTSYRIIKLKKNEYLLYNYSNGEFYHFVKKLKTAKIMAYLMDFG